jgi:CheY-like chemotaxis protein
VNETAPILIASDVVEDARLVDDLLRKEFANIWQSTDPDRVVADFEKHRPAVLVLAFDALERAERYYLSLYRLSSLVNTWPHRTLILCSKDDLQNAFELCKKRYFDDYVMFWPLTHDAPRLPMAVYSALRQLAPAATAAPQLEEVVAQAQQMEKTQVSIGRLSAEAAGHFKGVEESLHRAREGVGTTLDGLARQMAQPEWRGIVEVKDAQRLEAELSKLKAKQIDPPLAAVSRALEPVRAWSDLLRDGVAEQILAAGTLRKLAEPAPPFVLLIEDDELQLKIIRHLLSDAGLELASAPSGTQALAMLIQRRPDLILLDVGLPDIDGVELARQIKSIARYAAIPIIMVTGHSDKEVVLQSMKAGAAAFVVKPLAKDVLVKKIAVCLGNAGKPPAGSSAI